MRASQPDLVVHAFQDVADPHGPRIGFVVNKAVGSAVDRHRVARRLRHVTLGVVGDLEPTDRLVIRALPGSRCAQSKRLYEELATGIRRTRELMDRRR